jgi:cysteine synthase B
MTQGPRRPKYNFGLDQSDMSVATSGPLRTAASVVDLIGNTPLIRLTNFEAGLRNVELYAKAEWRNPGGSVKDRPAARMIADGEHSGALTHDKMILDATSGNTGIAYAMIGAARGYRVRLCVPDNVTPERKRILRAFGAEIIFTDPMQGSDGAIIRAKELYAADPGRYFYADQYNNPGNWRSHFDTTAPEILEQTGGRLTHFVAGLGTSGTFVGVGRKLREVNPSISTEEAHELTRRLAQDGLFVGISSGANLAGALRVARGTSDAVIVVVFCDGGEKYLSERFWDEGTTPTLALPKTVERAIRAHGAETYPNECCGALYGRDGVVTATLALSNTTDEGPRRRFLVRPQDYTAAERRASELGAELLGFYHSHPDHPARPSQYDLDHAWPFFSYIIVSVRAGQPEAMTSWRLREDRSAFDPERLTYAEHN